MAGEERACGGLHLSLLADAGGPARHVLITLVLGMSVLMGCDGRPSPPPFEVLAVHTTTDLTLKGAVVGDEAGLRHLLEQFGVPTDLRLEPGRAALVVPLRPLRCVRPDHVVGLELHDGLGTVVLRPAAEASPQCSTTDDGSKGNLVVVTLPEESAAPMTGVAMRIDGEAAPTPAP